MAMDGLWIFLTIICVAGMVNEHMKAKLKLQAKQAESGADRADFEDRFSRFEKRLANLESIIIERDRKSEFDQLLK